MHAKCMIRGLSWMDMQLSTNLLLCSCLSPSCRTLFFALDPNSDICESDNVTTCMLTNWQLTWCQMNCCFYEDIVKIHFCILAVDVLSACAPPDAQQLNTFKLQNRTIREHFNFFSFLHWHCEKLHFSLFAHFGFTICWQHVLTFDVDKTHNHCICKPCCKAVSCKSEERVCDADLTVQSCSEHSWHLQRQLSTLSKDWLQQTDQGVATRLHATKQACWFSKSNRFNKCQTHQLFFLESIWCFCVTHSRHSPQNWQHAMHVLLPKKRLGNELCRAVTHNLEIKWHHTCRVNSVVQC